MKIKEFWEVEIKSQEWRNERLEFYVFASSAREAEAKGLTLADKQIIKDGEDSIIWKPYCSYAKFVGYISL